MSPISTRHRPNYTKTIKFARSERVLFVVTEDWYFVSHRLQLAVHLKSKGYDVAVATSTRNSEAIIAEGGITLLPLRYMKRRNVNPFTAFMAIIELALIYRKFRPDIVHHVALIPVIIGFFAAVLSGVRRRVNAIAGLGFVFTSDSLKARAVRIILLPLLAIALSGRHAVVVVQNQENLKALRKLTHATKIFYQVSGAGVDIEKFRPPAHEPDEKSVVLVARMIWSKGIGDFAEVARRFREAGKACRFVLVGDIDLGNPAAVPSEKLEAWRQSGYLEWVGHKNDMPPILRKSTIICLPSSYGEGVPKSLIEAAACGRPIVAYDVVGCREIVRDGKNGLLVSPNNIDLLEKALASLLDDESKRLAMGKESRRIATGVFSNEKVFTAFEEIFRDVLRR
ncbi:MAG: glycosyltransferase family 1 protein [Rhodospirillaceae bacterium]|nr:glycosyltransferase family 1 protein [Rhodospirillaceae bacterium]